jgi:GGDEF domain-containing protein
MFSLNYFEARLDQEVRRCRRHEIPLCVLTLQTASGDDGWSEATARLVSVASRLLRAEDSVCHIGGAAYAISLPHTTPAGAAVVISRLSQELGMESPTFGLAYLPPGRMATSQSLIEHALRTPVRPETAEAAAASVEGREGEVAA